MVSRKKATGKARKAAKAKAREKAREEKERVADQPVLPKMCKHGSDPSLSESISNCLEFVRAFLIKVDDEFRDNSNIATCLVSAHNATLDEFAGAWNDTATMEMALSFIVCFGTEDLLEGKYANASKVATFARYFEQVIAVKLKQSQPIVNWPKIFEAYGADEHTLVKFFRHRIPCCCLDEKYEEVKHITKVGYCWNPQCSIPGESVERSKAKYCSRCRCATYCSRECHEANWMRHKLDCDNDAATIAEFEAKQQDNKA